MKKTDWNKVQKLSPNEFSENPRHAEPLLIYSLDEIRTVMNEKMYPSKVSGALARFSGSTTTQHYAVDRLSKACDVFCEGYPIYNFMTILNSGLFNGIGIYLDTNGNDGKSWVMFHLDIREIGFNYNSSLIWIATRKIHPLTHKNSTEYHYPQKDPKYWKLLKSEIMYESRTKIR